MSLECGWVKQGNAPCIILLFQKSAFLSVKFNEDCKTGRPLLLWILPDLRQWCLYVCLDYMLSTLSSNQIIAVMVS